jgi:DnaJ-class molecular chaperone
MHENLTREQALTHVGKGWSGLVNRAYDLLEGADAKVYTVKEKFGGLRIHFEGQSEVIDLDSEILKLEQLSTSTCENCGAPGNQINESRIETFSASWMKTLCSHCPGVER